MFPKIDQMVEHSQNYIKSKRIPLLKPTFQYVQVSFSTIESAFTLKFLKMHFVFGQTLMENIALRFLHQLFKLNLSLLTRDDTKYS